MILEMISIFFGVILLITSGYGYDDGGFEVHRLIYLLDFPSLIIVLVFTVPVLFKSSVWKDFKRAWRLLNRNYTCHLSELRRTLDVVEMMQKQLIYAGVICMLLSIISFLHRLSDPASLGPTLAVAILTMLYALVFEMVLLPLQLEVKRRIIDYMEIDTEAENERTVTENESAVTSETTVRTAAVTENGSGAAAGTGDDQI